MAHIDVRGPWPVYISNNTAVELGDRHQRTAKNLFPDTYTSPRAMTVELAEAVIEQIVWEDNLTKVK